MSIKITPIEITNEEIGAIKQKTPDKLPDRPTDAGWGAARIKAFLTGVLVDDNNSLLALLRIIVERANERLTSIIEQADQADEETTKSLNDLAKELENFKASMDRSEEDLNDAIKSLIDEKIYPWARAEQKPSYTYDEVGAMPADTFIPGKTSDIENDGNGGSSFSTLDDLGARIVAHGADTQTHGDIRAMLSDISARLAAVLDSDDTTLDELSEIVAYIKDNKELIDAITINKINVADIIDNLSTNLSDRPLSAAQGVVLAGLIANLTTRFDDFVHAGDESDPTVPDWAKEDTKPTYTPEEIGALPSSHATDQTSHSDIRLKLEELSSRLAAVLDSDDTTLDELSEIVAYIKDNNELIDAITINKVNVADIIDNLSTNLSDRPLSAAQGVVLAGLIASLNTRFDDFVHAGGETDPTVPDWAKEDTKPTYTPEEIGALPSSHNTDETSHSDIRLKLSEISTRLAAVLDSDDTTLDELSEIVAYIKDNKELIDAITINKVNVSDIVDNLLTSAANKPLSAAQGVVLKALIDESLFSRHFGTTAGTICQGNDSRLSNSRTPTSHASSSSTYGLASSSLFGHAKASATVPKANGSAKVGSETSAFARGDHVHPHDYPIGFPFVSTTNTSPTERDIPGTWVELPEGYTIVGAGSTYTVGESGGSADAVVVEHKHDGIYWNSTYMTLGTGSGSKYGLAYGNSDNVNNIVTGKTGEDGTGKNMPPYVAYYVWIRIA